MDHVGLPPVMQRPAGLQGGVLIIRSVLAVTFGRSQRINGKRRIVLPVWRVSATHSLAPIYAALEFRGEFIPQRETQKRWEFMPHSRPIKHK